MVSAEGAGNTRLHRDGLIQRFEGPPLSWYKRTTASEAVRAEAEGSSECFDDVTDTT